MESSADPSVAKDDSALSWCQVLSAVHSSGIHPQLQVIKIFVDAENRDTKTMMLKQVIPMCGEHANYIKGVCVWGGGV